MCMNVLHLMLSPLHFSHLYLSLNPQRILLTEILSNFVIS